MATPDLNFVARIAGVMALLVLAFIMFDGDLLMINQDVDNGNVEIVQSHKGMDRVICFHLQEPGDSEQIVYDYADYTESLLGHTSKILIPDIALIRSKFNFAKLSKRFGNNTILYRPDFVTVLRKMEWQPGKSLPFEAKKVGCDFLHILKSGETYSFPRFPEAFDSRVIRSGIHSFQVWSHHDDRIPAAALFPYVTDGVKDRPVVSPIVRPYSARNSSIVSPIAKNNSVIICTVGLVVHEFVQRAMTKLLDKHKNGRLQFALLGARVKTGQPKHPYLHEFSSSLASDVRDQVVDSCDALLHSKEKTDIYSLTITEFSARNKLILVYPGGVNKDYLPLLRERGHLLYHNESELISWVDHMVASGVDTKHDYNAFREFAPEIVMKNFKRVFLDPVFGKLDGVSLQIL